jgi:hypothetical protein
MPIALPHNNIDYRDLVEMPPAATKPASLEHALTMTHHDRAGRWIASVALA